MDNEILQKIKIGPVDSSAPDSEEDIRDLIDQMSPHIKEAYFATSTADEIYKAAKESGMSEDLMSKAAFLLGDVFLGILDPKDFTHELMNFGIPEVVAANFYRIISQSLFLKIKEELDQIYGSKPSSVGETGLFASTEYPQEEGGITRIKVEPPPLRRVSVHSFKEEQEKEGREKIATVSDVSQSKISDPYREKIDGV
ncbi:MAG: hypothetical protein UT37_C0001G0008 [Parcubacteria group bacterium GW2011_GWA2_39_18]|nr:MAG: hypothetical protein UT37_C0001G0008 [Parcubacteria group bacterium GW2011_GWA2_39_18]